MRRLFRFLLYAAFDWAEVLLQIQRQSRSSIVELQLPVQDRARATHAARQRPASVTEFRLPALQRVLPGGDHWLNGCVESGSALHTGPPALPCCYGLTAFFQQVG